MNLEDWIDRVKRVRDRNFIDELQVRAFLSTRKFVREIRRKKSLPLLFFYFFRFVQNTEFANLITSDYPECSDVCNDESTESCLWNDNILDILSKVRT